MKINKILASLILLICFSINSFAQHKLTKTEEASFNVSKNVTLKLESQFTEIVIEEWDKNQIQLKADFTAESSDENKTKELLDLISVKSSQSGNKVEIQSGFLSKEKKITSAVNGKQTFNVQLKLMVPKTVIYDATVKFGTVKFPDIQTGSNIEVQFSKISAKNVATDVKLNIKFSSLEIENIQNPQLYIEFANGVTAVKKMSGVADIQVKHSNVSFSIDEISNGKINAAFSKLHLISTKPINHGMFISTKFGKLHNNINLPFENIVKEKYVDMVEYTYNAKEKNQIKTISEFSSIILTKEPPAKDFYKSTGPKALSEVKTLSLHMPELEVMNKELQLKLNAKELHEEANKLAMKASELAREMAAKIVEGLDKNH